MASPSAHPDPTALPEEQEFASWKQPYRDAFVYVHRDLVYRLSSQSVQHLKKDTEIGGILWGKPGPGGSILVLNVTPVTSSGSRFNTSALDTRSLAQALNSPSPDPTLSPLGFFRSHIREGLHLSPQDRVLAAEHFPDPDSVILLLKPFQAGICTAAFFFWNTGSLPAESELEVPFVFEDPAHPEASAAPEEESIVDILRESALRHRTLHPPRHAPGPILAPRPRPPANRSPWRTLVAGALITVFLMIAGAAAVLLWPTVHAYLQTAQGPTNLGIDLRASPGDDGRLQITWNRNAPDIVAARGGILLINDGRFSPKLSLTPEQLRSGKLLYAPRTSRVQFRLALDLDAGRTLTESVLVANAKRRLRTPAAAPRAEAALPLPSNPPVDPGTVEAAPASEAPPNGPVIATLPGTQPPAPRTTTAPGAYAPPQAVQEMMPATTPAGQFAKIAIQVSINRQGRVVSARAEHGAVANDALTAIAISAARQWRFQPATLNGQPVPAEYTIVFVFRPQLH